MMYIVKATLHFQKNLLTKLVTLAKNALYISVCNQPFQSLNLTVLASMINKITVEICIALFVHIFTDKVK